MLADDEPLSGPKPEFTPDVQRATESVGRLAGLDIEHTPCYHGGYVERGSDRTAETYERLRR